MDKDWRYKRAWAFDEFLPQAQQETKAVGRWTELAKRLIALTPYRVVSTAMNRFQDIDGCLARLQQRQAYRPRVVIDGGAHLGSFALAAHGIFPEAQVHLVEPQPACRSALEKLVDSHGFAFHPYALSDRTGTARFMCRPTPSTGAYLAWNESEKTGFEVEVETRTLDELFAAALKPSDRTLLKLDLQGHELLALAGAKALLPAVEVVITEVSFFQQMGEPTIPALIGFFDRAGFDLFDVAALTGRSRDDRLHQGDFVFVRRGSAISADTAWF